MTDDKHGGAICATFPTSSHMILGRASRLVPLVPYNH